MDSQATAGGEPVVLIPKKRHSVARYGLRLAARLDARHDQMRWRYERVVYGYTDPESKGAVQARQGYERTLARYENELAEADKHVAGEQIAVFAGRNAAFDDINVDLFGHKDGYGA